MNISPRYLANIENKGQQPSLKIFYELVTRVDKETLARITKAVQVQVGVFDRYN